jgi:hypothetical protein
MRWRSVLERVAGLGRLVAVGSAILVLAGCYSYVPLTTLQPAPGTKLSLVLNDEGRVQTAHEVGPYTMRVEGELLRSTDADYVLAVTDVVDIRGARSRWTGEPVPLARSYVMSTYEKRFSLTKTLLLVGAATAGFVALVASRNLLGIGGSGGDSGSGGPPNGQ